MKNHLKLLTLTALAAATTTLCADQAFLQLSLTPDIALYSRDTTIKGVSLGIWGENPQFSFNLGLVNGSTGESGGFSWAWLFNYTDSYTGVHWALVNYSRESFIGWQHGLVNYSRGRFTGVQSGWVNVAMEFRGLQWGLVNYAKDLTGVQIGLANIAANNPWFSDFPNKLATGFPIVNWSF